MRVCLVMVLRAMAGKSEIGPEEPSVPQEKGLEIASAPKTDQGCTWWDLMKPAEQLGSAEKGFDQLGKSASKEFISDTLTKYEKEMLASLGLTEKQALDIKQYVNNSAQNAEEGLIGVWQKEHPRVLAIAENHQSTADREFTATLVKDLKAQGATHLALELPANCQPALDKFAETGDPSDLPAVVGDKVAYAKILKAACQPDAEGHKLKLVAVDIDSNDQSTRNKAMSANVGKILDADPNARVVMLGGSAHFARQEEHGEPPSLSDLLRDKGYKTCTVLGDSPEETLFHLTRELKESIMVPTKNSPLANLPVGNFDGSYYHSVNYGDYDYVLAYPDPPGHPWE